MTRDDPPSAKPLIDKLGVKPGARVAVLGIGDRDFMAQLLDRTDDVSPRRRARLDALFLGVNAPPDLRRLRAHRDFLNPDGAVWVVWPKGTKDVNENDIRNAAIEAGLVDVKVVSFSPTHSALKLVIRLKDR